MIAKILTFIFIMLISAALAFILIALMIGILFFLSYVIHIVLNTMLYMINHDNKSHKNEL